MVSKSLGSSPKMVKGEVATIGLGNNLKGARNLRK